MTYNFDPERWYENERGYLERELKAGRLTPAAFEAALEELERRFEQMWRRLDGSYQLPTGRP